MEIFEKFIEEMESPFFDEPLQDWKEVLEATARSVAGEIVMGDHDKISQDHEYRNSVIGAAMLNILSHTKKDFVLSNADAEKLAGFVWEVASRMNNLYLSDDDDGLELV